jgi:biotin transport system substrate-specific component
LLDALVPSSSALRKILLVVAGSAIVALTAQIALPLPFTAVPVTGQTFGVLLVGVLLGPRAGAAALVLYLIEGLAGLPVFAPFGSPGPTRLIGPTAGYLLAFPLAAWIVGRATNPARSASLLSVRRGGLRASRAGVADWPRPERGWQHGSGRAAWGLRIAASLVVAEAVIFTLGCSWLALWSRRSIADALYLGLFPFLPGEFIKLVILTGSLLVAGWRRRGYGRGTSRQA